ncbi:Protein TAPETUM DETERMINANT 1 [Bienertia sinuspersici]
MAASSIKILSAILCFFLVFQHGSSYKCGVSNIKVTTKRTGTTIEGQPQYSVTVTNNCPCAQSRVYLRCIGFSTVQPINPTVLKVKGDSCLLNNGRPISKGRSISFKYSFLQPTDLVPQRSEISC